MASFPGSKVHRPSRRKLGRGQHTQVPAAVITPSVVTSTVTLTFNVPVVVSGTIPTVSNTGTFVSQNVVSPTVVTQLWSTTQAAATFSLAANVPQITTTQGGGNVAFSTVF